MKIGIIGAGNIGGALTRRFRELGHKVSVANSRGPQTLAELARETGAKPVSVHEAARENDVVIVTIPQKNVPELPSDLFGGVPADVVIVDTGNYYPQQRDGRIEGIESGLTESRWVEQQVGRPVVKAFNNISPNTCSRTVRRRAARDASRCRWPQTRRKPKASSCGSSRSSASTRWTRAVSTSRGASSPARRCTRRTSTRRAYDAD